MKSKQIDIQEFTYDLPDSRIAKYPNEKRDNAKLLINGDLGISHIKFNQIDSKIPSRSTIVYNNSRVIHARIKFQKKTGSKIEIFCLSPHSPSDYQIAFEESKNTTWVCMVGNLKKWKNETLELDFKIEGISHQLFAEKYGLDTQNNQLIKFSWTGGVSFAEVLNATGEIPIPPYLNRETEEVDQNRYQTVYSQCDGSVAAPTAGLHFTEEVFAKLKDKQVAIKEVTLHVGAGTFQPVKSENAREHKMHGEQIVINKQFLQDIMQTKGKIIATGTTTMRTLESLYWLGVKTLNGGSPKHLLQWDWEMLDSETSLQESFKALIDYLDRENIDYLSAVTEIMIIPGYKFKVVDVLITNFHQPKSTLLLLIAAFVGEKWRDLYDYALNNDFKFLSYGDSSLLFRNQ